MCRPPEPSAPPLVKHNPPDMSQTTPCLRFAGVVTLAEFLELGVSPSEVMTTTSHHHHRQTTAVRRKGATTPGLLFAQEAHTPVGVCVCAAMVA
ncbi:hypothetical protein E3N88_34801 [Mikania micrantha]|uniref:Uncharacterized protein n=1 Tax=Mikania micrantha TaxID=192012 RepID=A0A5N6LZE6_9ASTR|nr:hypothetical protein E3N88_34801 [Mikania micrantha]